MVNVTLTYSSSDTTRKAARDAQDLAARLPRLVLSARRISANVNVGLHGRRRAGQGENFWQYRALTTGESISGIDWRRSARHAGQLYVREREWEAAHSIYIAIDRSASMRFRSSLVADAKDERAIILGLALADCLVKAGERVALVGQTRPLAANRIIERFAEVLLQSDPNTAADQTFILPPRSELVMISDMLDDLDRIEKHLDHVATCGATAHLVRIIDPAEEIFPFEGETELIGVEDRDRLIIGDATRFAERYRAAFQAHHTMLAILCEKKGSSLITHRTDRPATEAIQALVAHIVERIPDFQTVMR